MRERFYESEKNPHGRADVSRLMNLSRLPLVLAFLGAVSSGRAEETLILDETAYSRRASSFLTSI